MMSGTFKKIYWVILICLLFCAGTLQANAVNCEPPFNGNWVVPWNCTYNRNLKVFGDIIVGSRTITVPNGVTLGINLWTNKATFTTGKILFSGTAKMDNSVSTRNFINVTYGVTAGGTRCPSGYGILNTAGTTFQWGAITVVPSSGVIRCGRL